MLYNFGTQCPIQSPLPDHGIIRTLCDLRKWWNWWCSVKVCERKDSGGLQRLQGQGWTKCCECRPFEDPDLDAFCVFGVNVCQSQQPKFAVEVVWKLKMLSPSATLPTGTAFGISVKAHEDCCSAKKLWWQCRWPASRDP